MLAGAATLVWSGQIPHWRLGGTASAQASEARSRAETPVFSLQPGATIVVEGDSLVEGASEGDPDWPARLEALLGGRVSVRNRGASGDTAGQGQRRWAQAGCADFALVLYGANDAGIGGWFKTAPPVPVPEYRQALRAIVARHQSCGTPVALLLPLPTGSKATERRILPYREAAQLVASQTGTAAVDLAPALARVDAPLDYDGLHLSTAGRAAISAELARLVSLDAENQY